MRSRRLAVLDIGSDVITLIVQDSKNANNILFKGSKTYAGYGQGWFFNEEGLFNSLRSLIRECRIIAGAPEHILIGVPAEFSTAICKNISTSFYSRREITSDDIDSLLSRGDVYKKHPTYRSVCHFPVNYLLEDGIETMYPVGKTSSTLAATVSYVLADRRFIDFFNAIANVLNTKFEYTSSVQSEILHIIPPDVRDEGILLLDIGYISSVLAYARGDGIVHMASFSLGLGHIAGYLWQYIDMPFNHALALSHKLNLNLFSDDDDTYSIAINNKSYVYKIKTVNEIACYALNLITNTVKNALLSASGIIPTYTPILLTGSGISDAIGAKEFISKETSRHVTIIKPSSIQFDKPSQSSMVGLLREQNRIYQKQKSNIRRFFESFWRKK
ncbi:MAG: hypothetical protein LBF12_05425 [Christensenellaceae bacterium]|jgi:cell division ATPase FtsA|nr:hypothetical protein [Christensenellaceae bacterium]